jgi:hypothetical protein
MNPLEHLADEIWAKAGSPIALYLRGSYMRKPKDHAPWDIDFLLLTSCHEQIQITAKAPWATTLPPLDLTSCTVDDLLFESWALSVRLDIQVSRRLVRGVDIVMDLPPIAPSAEVASSIWPFWNSHVMLKQRNFARALANGVSEPELTRRIQSLIKATLRTAALGAMTEGRFLRTPLDCGAWICAQHHSIQTECEWLLKQISGCEQPWKLLEISEKIRETCLLKG